MTPEKQEALKNMVWNLIDSNLLQIEQQEPNKRGLRSFSINVRFGERSAQAKISATERHTDESEIAMPDGQEELPL